MRENIFCSRIQWSIVIDSNKDCWETEHMGAAERFEGKVGADQSCPLLGRLPCEIKLKCCFQKQISDPHDRVVGLRDAPITTA